MTGIHNRKSNQKSFRLAQLEHVTWFFTKGKPTSCNTMTMSCRPRHRRMEGRMEGWTEGRTDNVQFLVLPGSSRAFAKQKTKNKRKLSGSYVSYDCSLTTTHWGPWHKCPLLITLHVHGVTCWVSRKTHMACRKCIVGPHVEFYVWLFFRIASY